MNTDESRSAVLSVMARIAPEVDPETLDVHADLRSEADLDSLDFLSLVEGLAETTGVDIPEADYPQVRSLSGLVEYVAAHAGG